MKYYSSSDFYLAAVLCYLDFKLTAIDRPPNGKAKFVFERIDGLDEAIEAFWCSELKLEPKRLFANQKMLKARLYSE